MKKIVFCLMALLMCLMVSSALASIDVVGDVMVYSYSDNDNGSNPSIYFFADVVNSGSEDVSLSSDSTFTIYDANGKALDESRISMIPMMLKPGEKGVVHCEIMSSLSDSSSIKNFDYTLELSSFVWDEYVGYTGTPVVDPDGSLHVRVTNNSSATIWDTYGFIIGRDSSGRPVYVNDTIAYRIGIPAGESLEMPMFYDSDLDDFLKNNGINPVTYDAGGYTY